MCSTARSSGDYFWPTSPIVFFHAIVIAKASEATISLSSVDQWAWSATTEI
jgi:hypothetical protein